MEQGEVNSLSFEKHYTVFEIAEKWGLNHCTIRRLFENEPGVIIFGSNETRWARKRKTMRIPESVLHRVHEKYHTRSRP